MNFTVDVIIPVRYRDEYDVCERLVWKKESLIPDNINFIIVDYGSELSQAVKINKCCDDLGFRYVYVDKVNALWNASEARNVGILESVSDYLIFEDVDLKHSYDFYERINSEIEILIESGDWPFFVIPVTYLTEEGSIIAKEKLDNKITSFIISETYKEESEVIQHHAPASSFLVCKRSTAFLIGGYDESFEGWGFEDSDFWVRLLMNSDIKKPRDFFHLDTRNYSQQVSWRGWRSLFRVFADLVSNKGIYSFHIWHPVAEHRSTSIRQRNHKIFLQNCKRYSAKNFSFTPLINPKKPKQLFLSKNPHSWNEAMFSFFDNPIYIDEQNLDVNGLEKVLYENDINCVVFNNPYGSQKRTVLYEKVKTLGVKFYVVERGALPWSIYVDSDGFCAESTSYNEKYWVDHEMSDLELEQTRTYINDIKSAGTTLEPQSPMIGGENLKRKLFGDSKQVKVLFVALQSPSDTTTNFFCGQVGSYSNFIHEISKLPYLLSNDWKVVVKNHPLSIEKFSHPDIINVDDYHISDVLECCDAVALINSGVGVLAQIYGKYVYTYGQAFYSCEGVNKAVSTSDELVEELLAGNVFDSKKSFKFINYLVNHFYSFASWVRAERKHTQSANLSISLDITYKKIVIPREFDIGLTNKKEFDILKSHLFDRYRMDEYVNRTRSVPVAPKVTSSLKGTKVGGNSEKINKKVKVAPSKTPMFSKNLMKRKFNKLVKNPRLFIIDALLNIENKKNIAA